MLDASLYVALSFAVLVGVALYYGVPRRLLRLLDSKSAEIAKQLDEARQLRDDAKEHVAEARRREAAAEEDARAIAQQAEELAKAKAEEIAAALAARLARQQRQAEQRALHLEAEAMRQLRARSVDAAIAAVTQFLEEDASPAQRRALMDESLSRLDARLP